MPALDAEQKQPGDEASERAFRIFLRAFLVLGAVVCTFIVFDDQSPLVNRTAAGVLCAAGMFMIVAVGKPAASRLYTLAIGLFCLLLGGFGAVACLLDKACVPMDRG